MSTRGKGDVCDKGNPVSHFEQGRGMEGGVDREPGTPPSRVLSEGEVERT
jgi:hypothetical protein